MDLTCPRCGLRLPIAGPRHEYCPECLAQRDQPVPLVASSLFRLDRRGEGADRRRGGEAVASETIGAERATSGKHAF